MHTGQLITFDMLPDDVLIEIFDFYLDKNLDGYFEPFEGQMAWIRLAHVCRRWRNVVFQSPRRLNLRLLCTHKTRARDILDVWPPLPLLIHDSYYMNVIVGISGVDNIIATLEHKDRVCQIIIGRLTNSLFEYFTRSAIMQKPFPELMDLRLGLDPSTNQPGPIIPDSFLGRSAPRLRSLVLRDVLFPGLSNLLSSTTRLVDLNLYGIPRSWRIPPIAMAISLSALTSLKSLRLLFRHPPSRPVLDNRHPVLPPLTRSVLPNLTKILFEGASEYLEEILARIDAPQLNVMHITFFNQIVFYTPQLFQFISRRPTSRAPETGHIKISCQGITVKFPSQASDYGVPTVQISYMASDWQRSSLEQVCTPSLPPISTLEDLYILEETFWRSRWQGDVENTLWLELLQSFASVKNLYICKEFESRVAPALQELVGESTVDVLPILEHIFLEDFRPSCPLHKGIETFLAARRLTSHPVAVSRWNRDSKLEVHWSFYDL